MPWWGLRAKDQASGVSYERYSSSSEHQIHWYSQDSITVLWSQPKSKALKPKEPFLEPKPFTRSDLGQYQCYRLCDHRIEETNQLWEPAIVHKIHQLQFGLKFHSRCWGVGFSNSSLGQPSEDQQSAERWEYLPKSYCKDWTELHSSRERELWSQLQKRHRRSGS